MVQIDIAALCFLLLVNLVIFYDAQVITDSSDFPISTYRILDESFVNCQQAGTGDYYNSASYTCQNCPTNQTRDKLVLDGSGNSIQCKCAAGFVKILNNCVNDVSGSCVGIQCISCLLQSKAAYTDASACVPCGNSTLGLNQGDCWCPTNQVLNEININGVKSAQKTCSTCPTGK